MAQKRPSGFVVVPDDEILKASAPNSEFVPVTDEEILKAVKPVKPVTVDDDKYAEEIKKRLKNGAKLEDITGYIESVGRDPNDPKTQSTLKANIAYRDNPTRRGNYNPEIDPGTGAGDIGNFVIGGIRGVQHVLEGAAQAATRVGGLMNGTLADPEKAKIYRDAQEQLAQTAAIRDETYVKGKAGGAGEFVGEVIPSLAVPITRAGAIGRGLSALKTTGMKALPGLAQDAAALAASGAATGAITGAEATPEAQDSKALLSGALTVLGVPLVERLVSKVGVPLARRFYDRFSTGVGKQLFDATGALTPAGRLFRVRLKHAAPGIDDAIIDDAMQQIRTSNPKRLPADKDVVPEMISQREGVPLTQGMRTRDAKKMQDFASTATGARGLPSSQNKALEIDQNIDTAILNNVNDVKGTNVSSTDAADDLATQVGKAANRARDVKNKMYEPLNKSGERIVQPRALLTTHDDFVSAVGETGFRTMRKTDPVTAAFADELRELGRKKVLPFGEVWSLSKRINEAARNPNASGPLRELRTQIRAMIDNAPPSMFESGDRGVFDQLKRANAANRDYKTRFSPQNRKSLRDVAGQRVESIVSMFNDPASYSAQKVEEAVFGKAKGLGNKETEVTVRRLIKANPAAQQPLREMAINRTIDQMADGVASISGDTAINATKAAKVLDDVVSNNTRTLKALGLTDSDISKLRNNAYLAALKVPAQGARARGSSATNRGVVAFKGLLTKALTHGGPFVGLTTQAGGLPVLTATLAGAGVAAAAAARSSSKITRKALSIKALPGELSRGDRIFLNGIDRAVRTSVSRQSKGDKK